MSTSRTYWNLGRTALVVALWCASHSAQAGLFDDDEARRAILDLRQRIETLRERTSAEDTQLRRSLLDLQSQIETLRGDLARVTDQNEQLTRSIAAMQQRQNAIDERVKKTEPSTVNLDGQEFTADRREKTDFDAALEVFRAGQFAQAQTAFADFIKRYPQSGYTTSALFWLGNTQYALRNYKEAIKNFRSMLSLSPDHAKAPEAVLSVANCQIELNDVRGARRTLEDLSKAYPKSEAAQAGRERLAHLK